LADNVLYPEPQGYRAYPGFVKSNPLNNDYYVEQFKDDPWYPIIKRTHERLTELVPGYNIAQIKEKFGGLRYYVDFPDGVLEAAVKPEWRYLDSAEKVMNNATDIIRYAEAWVDGFEYRTRQGLEDEE
jgi:hypothetical protein